MINSAGIIHESMDSSSSSSSSLPEEAKVEPRVWWMEALKGWSYVLYSTFVQKFQSRHLKNSLPLPALNDVTCIVTGSTSGIGLEIARQLAVSGASLVMAVRNQSAAYDLIKKWRGEWHGTGQLNVEVMELNLLSLNSVVKFVKVWNNCSSPRPLQVLINNAGIFSIGEPQKFSEDGYEKHLQVNHLAPALLSVLLLPCLLKGFPSRIINVNTSGHYMGIVDTNDMNLTSGKQKYNTSLAYSSSKLAQVMFSSFLQNLLPTEAGISVVCVSPGSVCTNLIRNVPKLLQDISYFLSSGIIFSAQEGSRSAIYAATNPEIVSYCERLKGDGEWRACAYISHDCRPAFAAKEANNMGYAKKVWEKTLEMIGLPLDAVEKLLQGKEVVCKYEDC